MKRISSTIWPWTELNEPFERLSTDAIMSVSSGPSIIWLNNPDAIEEVLNHRERFPKRVHDYQVLNIFGKNLISTEGKEWRAHRKVTSPGFSDHNNRLMFKESIRQAHGMIRHWFKGGTENSTLTLNTIPQDTMRTTLNAISAVAFGVRMLWPGEKLDESVEADGFMYYPDESTKGHTMSLQASVEICLRDLFFIMVMPKVLLSK